MNKAEYYIAVFVFLFAGITYSQQYCITGRFDTTYYFGLEQVDTLGNISYGQNTDWLGNPVNLKFIISYPKLSIDPLQKRPFILMIHGGGFYAGDKYDLKIPMLDFSARGYVCASIDYRVGWNTGGNPALCLGDGFSLSKAVYRAMQDSKAAFRYFKANANIYGIDTNYMFAAGISAGAVTSLMISFAAQQDINNFNPVLSQELGLLDTATNSYRNSFKIKSIVSISGGLLDTVYIKNSNVIPTLMFHGTADAIVPYGTGYVYNCTNYLKTMGSDEIRKRFRNLIKPFELDYVPGGGHENYYPIEYFQTRTVKFLKRYLCNQAKQIVIENYTTLLDTLLGSFIHISRRSEEFPAGYKLYQNYPNPFNPTTKIDFDIPRDCYVSIKIYDVTGRVVKSILGERKPAGNYTVSFTSNNLAGGVYFYKLFAGDFSEVKRMMLIK